MSILTRTRSITGTARIGLKGRLAALLATALLLFTPFSALSQSGSTPTVQFPTVADMVAARIPATANRLTALVTGRVSTNDGGGGIFFYDSASAASTNFGTIFKPAASNGRWLRQYSGALNVKWFGAVGDGINDDTASITNAVSVSQSNSYVSLFFPKGTYRTTDSISITRGMNLIGDGSATSVIKPSAAVTGACIIYGVSGDAPRPSQATSIIEGLQLDGSDTTSTNSHGIFMFCSHTEIRNCYINNFAGHGIYALQAWSNTIRDNRILGNGLNGVHLDPQCNAVTIQSNYILDNTQHGIHIVGCNSVNVLLNDIEGNDQNGVRVTGSATQAARSVSVLENYFENNATEVGFTDDIYVDRSGNEISTLVVDNNYHESSKNIQIVSINSAIVRNNARSVLVLGDEGYNVFTENQTMGSFDSTVSNSQLAAYTSNNSSDGFVIEGRLTGILLKRKAVGVSTNLFYVKSPANNDLANGFLAGSLAFSAISSASAQTNSIFHNSADNLFYFKDNSGVDHALYQISGTATLVGGTVTVANTSITANTRVFVSRSTLGGTPGHLSTTQIAATSFTVNSSDAGDTSTVNWLLIEP